MSSAEEMVNYTLSSIPATMTLTHHELFQDGRRSRRRCSHHQGSVHYHPVVTNIIIHGLNIHDCKQGGSAIHRTATGFPSSAAATFGWIATLSNCKDGLIDAIYGSTAITISNKYMSRHDKVMLLGHSDSYTRDKNMQVTIAFNHFSEGLVQRMPRCRHGYFHVVNNDYTRWEIKEVTKHEDATESEWKPWNWRSKGNLMVNGSRHRAPVFHRVTPRPLAWVPGLRHTLPR
ncbi:putative pectate lyase 18 [Hibiscus syriacus]|uniref:Pectate lyase 18 n=1 Tax=Hibiscus syriacus TaxID=106335 RepID=A0A6A2XN00_HIBSY|nr:putative pectate lyase 18 [Hibiscus syriacus]